jgi:hypothetical protein
MGKLTQTEKNKLKRLIKQMKDSAKECRQGIWRYDHGHVVSEAERKDSKKLFTYDVLCVPWLANQCISEPNPFLSSSNDIKHAVHTQPRRILQLAELVEKLLEDENE